MPEALPSMTLSLDVLGAGTSTYSLALCLAYSILLTAALDKHCLKKRTSWQYTAASLSLGFTKILMAAVIELRYHIATLFYLNQ